MDQQELRAIADAARLRAVMPATRSVRRAKARMERPRGRKATKAARRVATWNFARARDAIALMARTVDAREAKAGQMPHAPRTTPRLKLRHGLSESGEKRYKLVGRPVPPTPAPEVKRARAPRKPRVAKS